MNSKRFPRVFYNPVTFAGLAIAAVSFGLILFLIILEIFGPEQKPYMGIIAFVVLPGFLIIGIATLIAGAIVEHFRIRAGKTRKSVLPIINLNIKQHRNIFIYFATGILLFLFFSAFGTYKAYEYTDSDEFCGTICHKVMSPEFTAYQTSPHARVGCVNCHIGSGAEWYVRSKVSGLYQVYSVLFNKYSKPIPTPIENLRPAQETCEKCHWPNKFYRQKEVEKTYFLSDENNSKWSLILLMKIGGGNEETGVTKGIHWHMNIANEISYLAIDNERQVIPWVKSKSADGNEVIYKSDEFKDPDSLLNQKNIRKMDCIDCHNRPAHIYNPPSRSVNNFMAANLIDAELPYIKSLAVKALEVQYSSSKVALDSIKIFISDFYKLNYPNIYSSKRKTIDHSIAAIQKIFSRNYFPEMNVNWKYFPENTGHTYSPGCFRCHDGKHFSEDGKVISKDCTVCHTIVEEKINDSNQISLTGIDYKHPVDVDKSWRNILCSNCHTKKLKNL